MSKEVTFALSLIVLFGLIPASQKLIRKHRNKKVQILKFSDRPMNFN